MFRQANSALREGRLDEALALYHEAIGKSPEFFPYHENLALTLERLGRADEAVSAYRRVIELHADSVVGRAGLRRLDSAVRSSGAALPDEIPLPATARSWIDPEPVRILRAVKPRAEAALKMAYKEKGLHKIADTFVLYRIIGNDLYPRHAKGQSRQNVQFILANEPEFPDCTKRWVLNRILDAEERQAILQLLDDYRQSYVEIPFVPHEFAQVGWDFSRVPAADFLASEEFAALGPNRQNRVFAAIYAAKNRYLMNNNGARNAALEDGIGRAKWVLPWDGNCFLTRPAWDEIVSAVKQAPHLSYFVVPMERLTDNDTILTDGFVPSPVEEPQMIFRQDASERFNLSFPYGRRPKVELFWRLGIPGSWDRWKDDIWDQPRRAQAPEAGQFGVAGWVGRLFSGQKELETADPESFRNRGLVRQDAIISTINLATHLTASQRDSLGLSVLASKQLERLQACNGVDSAPADELVKRAILRDAADALTRQPGSVLDKTELPPSGDPHDYFHPAPYWWPDPDKPDGLPYKKRDGIRVPGTLMYESESNRYDRTRLQRLFDDGLATALAWRITGESRYSRYAADSLRRWFLAPQTRMNPHLTYSQVRRGKNGNKGNGRGIIEMKDLYYYLDAVRLIEGSGELTRGETDGFREWLATYMNWLLTSKSAQSEALAANNHGTYFDLQLASIAAYLDRFDVLQKTLIRSHARLSQQISAEGWQHEEMKRTQTAHYCCFNLQGWLNLAILGARYGNRLLDHQTSGVALLPQAVRWLLRHFGEAWPYQQIEEFDKDRFVPIAYLARSLGLQAEFKNGLDEYINALLKNGKSFHPHDGIPPFWPIFVAG